jgi:hypothetical protein
MVLTLTSARWCAACSSEKRAEERRAQERRVHAGRKAERRARAKRRGVTVTLSTLTMPLLVWPAYTPLLHWVARCTVAPPSSTNVGIGEGALLTL